MRGEGRERSEDSVVWKLRSVEMGIGHQVVIG